MIHPALVSCAVVCTLVQNVLPSETENAEVSNTQRQSKQDSQELLLRDLTFLAQTYF